MMLSGAEGELWKAWKHVAFGYCMRYWGVDAGEYFALTEEFYDWIRTVNWLTFLGPSMLHDLETMGARLKPVPEVLQQTLAGGTVLLKAGASPQRGDVNRLDILPTYAAVDRLVRARRCNGTDDAGDEVTFFAAWTRTAEWFRRFERAE